MSDAAITLLTLGVVVALFVWNRLPVELVAVGSALILYATGVLTLPQALAGFGDPAVVFIAALFIVSESLDSSGVTAWVAQAIVGRSTGGWRRLLVLIMILAAVLTALIGLNGTAAALIPMVVVIALRRALPPSRLLMPLAFAGSAGGLLLLTGSPVNVVISEAAADAGVGPFGFFEFAIVGVPLVIGTVLLILAIGSRVLPDRESDQLPPDLSGLAGTIVRDWGLDRVWHLRVTATSALVGRPRVAPHSDLPASMRIVTVMDGASGTPTSQGAVAPGDRITMLGDQQAIASFAAEASLDVESERTADDVERDLLTKDTGVAEAVIPPRSLLTGETVAPSQVVDGGLVVLGISRGGSDLGGGATRLREGDVVLVEGSWEALDAAARSHDLLIVNSPELVRRQTVPLGRGSVAALVVLGAMVLLLATGIVPAVVAALVAALAMVLLRVVTVQQAYRGISWTTVLLVAGMIPMATAVTTSGAGDLVASVIVDVVGDAGPVVFLAAMFAVTVVFGQLISNTATALIMIPIAVSAAEKLDISARPVLMSLCVAAAVAFLTPVSTPANLMVMGPGGYRFGDYWKLGLPLVILFGVVSIGLVPLVWRF
ncbi:MAG: TRAP transporter large permease subunit [Actinomycetales bacterium]|nr:TRAP transporter large permease subunit [Actinomycetales bacterium]